MKRKAFKTAVQAAMGRGKTRGSSANRKAAKYEGIVKSAKDRSREDTSLRRLLGQKTRLSRALGKATTRATKLRVHIEGASVYSDAATEGEDFALAERLFHLRHIHEVGIVGEADATAETSAAGAAVTADGDEAGAGDGGIVDEALTRTTDQLRGQYVLGLLEANEVDDARAALDRWADDTSTELAWSRALLAYARWRPTVDEDDEDEDEEQESDDDDDDDDGEAAPALVAAVDNDDSDAAVGDGGPELEEAAKEALRIATTTNHHIAQIMSSIEQFARVIDPSDLRGARATETAGYPGSIEEALTYMSDSGMMWMERSGLEEWVSEVLADHPNMQAQPRKCMGSKKFLRLYTSKVANGQAGGAGDAE